MNEQIIVALIGATATVIAAAINALANRNDSLSASAALSNEGTSITGGMRFLLLHGVLPAILLGIGMAISLATIDDKSRGFTVMIGISFLFGGWAFAANIIRWNLEVFFGLAVLFMTLVILTALLAIYLIGAQHRV